MHIKSLFIFLGIICSSTNLLAQDLDYSKYRYFEEDKEFQVFFNSTKPINGYLTSIGANNSGDNSVVFSKIDFESRTAEHKMYKNFNPYEVSFNATIDNKTYVVSEENSRSSTHLYVFEKDNTTDEFENTEYILESNSSETTPGAVFVINDRTIYVSVECPTQGPDNRIITLRIYSTNDNNHQLELLKTTTTTITEFQDIGTVNYGGFSDHLLYIQLIGTNSDGVLIKFDAQDFTTTKLPLNNRFSILGWSVESSFNKFVSDSGFVMAQIVANRNNTSKKKLLFSHYNTTDQEWYYNNENSLLRIDSLTFGDSKIFNATFNQLPNGDYIATANVYEYSLNEWHASKRGYQRTLLQVFSNEKSPKIKAAYFYELPNGSNILSSIIQPDSTILLIGYSQDDDGVFSTLYLNIGKGPGAVGVNDNETQTHLKFSLINNHQNLRLFNPQISRVEIYDEWGRLLIAKDSDQQNIDISSLSSGLYILRTKTQGETAFRMTNFVKP